MVTDCGGSLVVPTGCSGKLRPAGTILKLVPIPVRPRIVGLAGSLLVTVIVPYRLPEVDAVKVALRVQDLPAPSEPAQSVLGVKSELFPTTLLMLTGVVPLFVRIAFSLVV